MGFCLVVELVVVVYFGDFFFELFLELFDVFELLVSEVLGGVGFELVGGVVVVFEDVFDYFGGVYVGLGFVVYLQEYQCGVVCVDFVEDVGFDEIVCFK